MKNHNITAGAEGLKRKYKRLISSRGWIPFSGSALLAVIAWIFVPSAYRPYVRVSGSELQFSSNCAPESAVVSLMTPEAATSPSNIMVLDQRTNVVLKTAAVDVHATTSEGSARYWIDTPPEILAAARATQDRVSVEYFLFFQNASNIDVTEVTLSQGPQSDCGSAIWTGGVLFRQVSNEKKTLLHYKLLQEELASILFRYNAEVSNFVLGLMLVALFWEVYLLGLGLWPLYTDSDASLLRRIDRRHQAVPPQLQRRGAEATVRADFEGLNRRLIFAKTMGPAFGFLLTVSSLSAALHPSSAGPQDTLQFVTAIEVAVVATFVGLEKHE